MILKKSHGRSRRQVGEQVPVIRPLCGIELCTGKKWERDPSGSLFRINHSVDIFMYGSAAYVPYIPCRCSCRVSGRITLQITGVIEGQKVKSP
jgi:hypothetical protein